MNRARSLTRLAAPAALGALLALAPACRTAGGGRAARDGIAAGAKAPLRESLVELHATCVATDSIMPWRKGRPENERGYAVAVAPRLLLAPEELVRNHTLTEIRRAGGGTREAVRVRLADPRAGLALLELPERAAPLRPLAVAREIRRDARHTLARFGAGDQLQQSAGVITAIDLDQASAASEALLTFEIVSDLRAGRPGTPVLRDGRLAGLVLRVQGGSDASLAIAPDVITAFLAAAARQPYVGAPSGGFDYAPLIDPVRRRFLGVTDNDRGVQIVAIQPGSSAEGVLRAEDVLLSWDGLAVDNQGFYTDPAYGRLPLVWLVASRRAAGERVAVEVVRQGTPLRLEVLLRAPDESAVRVPENATGAPNDYLVEGGLVFRELTLDYLQAHGARWALKAESRLVWEALTQAYRDNNAGQRVLLLSAVLPDPVNIGYQGLRNEIVIAVNGRPVANLRELAARLAADGGLADFELEGWRGVRLYLDKAALPAANARIQSAYRIPSLQRIAPAPAGAQPR